MATAATATGRHRVTIRRRGRSPCLGGHAIFLLRLRGVRAGALSTPAAAGAAAATHGSLGHTTLGTTTHLEVRLLRAASQGRLLARHLEAGLLEHTLERLHGRATATAELRSLSAEISSCVERRRHLFVLTSTEFYAEHVTHAGGSTVNCWALAAPFVRR